MTIQEVAVVRTGIANLASVFAALGRLNATPRLVHDGMAIERAARLMLPGVGSFGAAMAALTADGLIEPLRARLAADRPTLAVCVGLQVLFAASEESPGVAGLGVLAGTIARFDARVRVPQLGWNEVVAGTGCRWIRSGYAYFANSYRASAAPAGCASASADHGGPFVAGLERGALLALQCHPELSGRWGHDLLGRWMAAS
ncbi:MAG: imidazole glycerol phosphate synthase subunit HisH [Alphaproteobacteria bacterium]|nr:imidazole glycerol phosphate synthase subunit HisH [Alphaproteobacteria bacterium]